MSPSCDRPASKHRVTIPTLRQLRELQAEGKKCGYRGIYIYLRYRAILETLADRAISRTLVIGCGYGIFDRLLPASINLIGIDIAAEAIEHAARWAARHRPSFTYKCGDFRSLTAHEPDGAFDTIFLSEVVEHVEQDEIESMLDAVARLLAPDGRLLISVPNHWHPRNRARVFFRRPTVLMDPTHLREYDLDSAAELVARSPFRVDSFRPAVLYLPCENWLRAVIAPSSPLRESVISRLPRLASHFIYLLAFRGEEGPPPRNSSTLNASPTR